MLVNSRLLASLVHIKASLYSMRYTGLLIHWSSYNRPTRLACTLFNIKFINTRHINHSVSCKYTKTVHSGVCRGVEWELTPPWALSVGSNIPPPSPPMQNTFYQIFVPFSAWQLDKIQLTARTLPGRWVLLQPGVNAPGTPKMTTFLPAQSSAMLTLVPGLFSNRSTEGTASPTATGAILVMWSWRLKLRGIDFTR